MRLTHSYRSARNAKIRRSHRLSIGAIETLEARRLMAVGIDEISLDWQTHQPIRDVLPMSDGSLWFTGYNDGNGVQNGVWRRSPSGAVSSVTALDDLLQPDQILQGPDGAIWVMSGVYGQNGQVTKLKDNVATHFDMHGDPNSMAIGADGTLWVAVGKTDYGWSSNPAIVRVTPDGSVRSAVSLDATPTNLIAGITGDLWFDQSASGILGHLTSDGVIATYAIPNDFGPNSGQAAALAVGPDGSLWLSTRSRTGNAATLVHLATDGTSVSMPLDPRSNVTSLIPAADGSIWYTDSGLDAVGKLATNGQITAIPTPTDQTTPFGLTSDGSRGFWYVAGASKFGHVVTNLPEPMITVTNLAFTATEGPITSDTIIASFTTTDLTATAADFVSRVDFGTATSQSRNGEIRAAGPGEFVVLAPRGGSNAYGTALMTVTILDAKHHNAVGASSTILGVANFDVILPVIVGRFNAVPARSNTSVFVAEVSDASVTGTSTMTIDWGDGTTSDGSASTWGLNQYWVMGTHS